jgi:outer membrane protein TolC
MSFHLRGCRIATLALAAVAWAGLAAGLRAQAATPLTLAQAVSIALEKNPLRKAALAEGKAAQAGVREARSGLFPQLTFSEEGFRSNDPVFVFGTELRQHRFTLDDFNLGRLNTPTPIGNFATRFSGNWNLFDSFTTRLNVQRAEYLKDAADRQTDRTDQELILHVIEAYDGLLLAEKNQEVAEQSVSTAQSILEQSKTRFESGLTVEADLLSAEVNLAERQQSLIRARNDEAFALAQLDNAMGVAASAAYQPQETLTERKVSLEELAQLEQRAIENRPDLKRIASEEAAQAKSVAAAKSAFGPRVNAVASWEADNTTFVGNGGNNWLAGVELELDLFEGGAKAARLGRERAIEERLDAMRRAAEDAVRLEVRHAYYDVDAARQQMDVARSTLAQAQESLRINQNRYNAGLSTITDLLRVEDAVRRTRTDYWQAVYRVETSLAHLEYATGILSSQSSAVTR